MDLIINTTKTVAMSFHQVAQSLPLSHASYYKIRKSIIMPEVKFLAMCITKNLSWQAHICSIWHRLSKTFFITKSVKNILSSYVLWNIYFAHFDSRLGYGIILGVGTKESIKAFCIQKEVIRLITGIKKYINSVDRNLRKIEFLQWCQHMF